MSIFTALTLILVVLKLLGKFERSWWLVFTPVIIEVLIIIVLGAALALMLPPELLTQLGGL